MVSSPDQTPLHHQAQRRVSANSHHCLHKMFVISRAILLPRDLVGRRVFVESHQKLWFTGKILSYDPRRRRHHVYLDFGEEELVNINTRHHQLMADLTTYGLDLCLFRSYPYFTGIEIYLLQRHRPYHGTECHRETR